MNLRLNLQINTNFSDPQYLFRNAVSASLLFHMLFFGSFYLKKLFGSGDEIPAIEIDLTKPFRIGNPLLKPGGGNLKVEPKNPGPPIKAESSAKEVKPKDWVLPTLQTKVIEKPVEVQAPGAIKNGEENGTPGAEGVVGQGPGYQGGEGEGGGIPLTQFPKLINKKEILKLLRRNYPPAEKEAGRESTVIAFLHISPEGAVTAVEIAGSGGASFDGVAKEVARKMRFTPAMMHSSAVAAKIRQSIVFKLEPGEE